MNKKIIFLNHSPIFAKKNEVLSRKFIIRTFAIVGLYIAASSYIFKNEEKFFFEHEVISASDSYSFNLPFKEINIKVNQETQLHALLFPRENPKGLVLLFPSGNYLPQSFNAHDNYFYNEGFSLLIPDYKGTGKSNSVYKNEDDIYKDAQQWYKMAHSLADSLKLIVYGEGFGAGIAAWVGGEFNADLIILESPYYSWNEIMLKKYFWMLPHTLFTQYKIPTWEFIRKSTNKTILIHASQAGFIKYENSQRLLEFLKPGDELITLDANNKEANLLLYNQNMKRILSQY